jgi:hypothetical protein
VLYTDEASFTRESIINSRNNHVWADENPHATLEQGRQQRFYINVWCGIVHYLLISPYVLPARLKGPIYRDFLEQSLPELLEDVPLHVRRSMWFMYDEVSARFSMQAREYLNTVLPARWSFFWPACSPDLNPHDVLSGDIADVSST